MINNYINNQCYNLGNTTEHSFLGDLQHLIESLIACVHSGHNVPEVAWNFYIGGYQPAQKWLKDRKDRTLEFDDILHYQKIIVALIETDRLMKEIDGIGLE